jgi:hypothetical protein
MAATPERRDQKAKLAPVDAGQLGFDVGRARRAARPDSIAGQVMATKTLADYAQEKYEQSRRHLGLAAIDFSISDERLLELRKAVRLEAGEARRLKKKKGFLGFLRF